jgi:hypothetical protein
MAEAEGCNLLLYVRYWLKADIVRIEKFPGNHPNNAPLVSA